VELFGRSVPVDEVAAARAETIGNGLLTARAAAPPE